MGPIPRVLSIQDLSGFGRCSLTIALPVLSAMGCQCCPLPTAYLSTHTGFPGNTFVDMSQPMEDTMAHWKELSLRFDGVYSGFLGSERQIELVSQCFSDFSAPGAIRLVDPVMGDHGKLYRTYTPALCAGIQALATQADIITPNLTEAAVLLGLPPHARPDSQGELEQWAARLSLDGTRRVVITGVAPRPNYTGALCVDSSGPAWIFCPCVPGRYHGTGDLFACVLLGGLLNGKSLPLAARQGVDFVSACMRHTVSMGVSRAYGVEFEPMLGQLL